MVNIRREKYIRCRWAVTVNGGKQLLEGMELRLVLHDPLGNHTEIPLSVEGSEVVFSIAPELQKSTGRYSATLYATAGEQHTAVDACDFLRIVSTTCAESPGSSSDIELETVELTGDLQLGVQGDSAYEVWLKAGNEGTIEDFLNWLRTPIQDTVPVMEDLGETSDL